MRKVSENTKKLINLIKSKKEKRGTLVEEAINLIREIEKKEAYDENYFTGTKKL